LYRLVQARPGALLVVGLRLVDLKRVLSQVLERPEVGRELDVALGEDVNELVEVAGGVVDQDERIDSERRFLGGFQVEPFVLLVVSVVDASLRIDSHVVRNRLFQRERPHQLSPRKAEEERHGLEEEEAEPGPGRCLARSEPEQNAWRGPCLVGFHLLFKSF
jgi:hypothetical protein